MKKFNLLFLLMVALFFGACESEVERDIFEQVTPMSVKSMGGSQMKAFPYSEIQTRGSGQFVPLWAVGEKVGVFIQSNQTQNGPIPFTISNISSVIEFTEPIPFMDTESLHTFYAYHPYEASSSTNPEAVNVPPVFSVQEQSGATSTHLGEYEYNIAIPTSIYPDEDLFLYFTSTYSFFEFQISSNVTGLSVKNIKVEAPEGKIINFTEATANITLPLNDPGFAQYSNLKGGTSETLLNIDGGLPVPNTTTEYASAYMIINPFDARDQKLKVTVTTEDDKEYSYQIEGENYRFGSRYTIPLFIESENKPVIKDIRVLSLCEVGCLGTKDNTRKWDCYYGALNLHAKEMRRLLFEHFGKGKTVETGVISFEKTDIYCFLNKLTDAYLDKFNIIYLNNNARPSAQTSQRIMNWLNKSKDRVLMLAYDWKDPCLTPATKESTILCKTATNYLMFRDQIKGVKPHWYNSCKVNKPIGNWGAPRSGMMVPFELNQRTSYFWKDGPFKTSLTESSDQRFWVEDRYWGAAEVSNPNVIPLITYSNAKDDCYQTRQHKYGAGDGGMILGVDPASRIVYIGDSEIFSVSCVTSKVAHARMSKEGGVCNKPNELNNFSKIMGNLWAWMIQEVIQKN